MSLVIDIKINSKVLTTVEITRLHREARPVADYRVTVFDHEAHTETRLMQSVRHIVGEGHVVLARKALEMIP